MLLKGSALLELKKISDAILHYREALRLEPHRYEAHKGLVIVKLSQNSPIYFMVKILEKTKILLIIGIHTLYGLCYLSTS